MPLETKNTLPIRKCVSVLLRIWSLQHSMGRTPFSNISKWAQRLNNFNILHRYIFRSLWGPQEWVTLMPIVESGPKLNLYEILGMSLLSASWSRYYPDNIFPIICLWETNGQVTLMWRVWSAPKSNSSMSFISSLPAYLMKIRNSSRLENILNNCLYSFSASLLKIWLKMKSLSSGQGFSIICLWETNELVALMWIVRSAPKLTSSKIL